MNQSHLHPRPPSWLEPELQPIKSRASVVLGAGMVVDGGIEEDDSYEESIRAHGGMRRRGDGEYPDDERTTSKGKESHSLMKVVSRLEDGRKVIGFGKGDPENPYNWSLGKRYWLTFLGIMQVTNSTFTSSITSGASPYIADEFNIPVGSLLRTLPISVFLVGYIIGPIAMGPLSEYYGRRWMIVGGFIWFMIWGIGSAVAPTLESFLIMRFLCGLGASVPLTIVGAIYADIWDDPQLRGRFIAIFCAATSVGPVVTPAISGFVSASRLGWRFSIWVAIMLAGVTAIPICFYAPETFGPVLLLQKAKRLRKETGDDFIVAPMELDNRKVRTILANSFATPFKMCFTEAIVGLSSLYLGLVYGTFYLSFQSYPIIFMGKYGFSTGLSGLTFISMGVGSVFSYPAVLAWDSYLRRYTRLHPNKPFSPEFRRLPIACLGGTTFFLSLFWLGWSGNSGKVHWMVPVASGIPFGFGYVLVFIAVLNYITDAYGVYSAGGLAANSMVRSIFGALLPLAAGRMYAALGVGTATSVLGAAAVVLTGVPFLFLKFGDRIRAGSKFCQKLLELKAHQAARDERQNREEKEEAAAAASAAASAAQSTSGLSRTSTIADLDLEKEGGRVRGE